MRWVYSPITPAITDAGPVLSSSIIAGSTSDESKREEASIYQPAVQVDRQLAHRTN